MSDVFCCDYPRVSSKLVRVLFFLLKSIARCKARMEVRSLITITTARALRCDRELFQAGRY